MLVKKKIKVSISGLLSSLLLQFFLFQVLKMSLKSTNSWYFHFVIKVKHILNTIFGITSFSIGDYLYIFLSALIIIWLLLAFINFIKKRKDKITSYFIKILFLLNILYGWFMFSFGLLYNFKTFIQFENPQEKFFLNDYKIVAKHLFNECLKLKEEVSNNKKGEFTVDRYKMIREINLEQNAFYGISRQKENVKVSLFNPIMNKLGILGYYNPFTGEAQVAKGIPDTSVPFTIAHEMGHQAGVAREDEANFYAFYMGESSLNKDFQYSVKYKALNYLLREIYVNDSAYVHIIIKNYSEGMKMDREKEKKYYLRMSRGGSDVFSYINNIYLKSNSQKEGIIAYNNVSKMIVSFYKNQYPSLFEEENPIYGKDFKME
ncbi:DUF3810 domain-containing protein [uncultured Apibacter sp.]|uniref:DUF3810 domain-containing protein n=1 Tax=uncultured Apibacter sp. TaxID=1778616 RepID=UPI003457388D